jgi:PPK2 family polyphosphate:nucleotide phosphotransferase
MGRSINARLIYPREAYMNRHKFLVPYNRKIRLSSHDPEFTGKFKSGEEAQEKLGADVEKLAKLQDVLYAQDTYALLLIFQAMDAAGKDGIIKHIMSGINPQGCQVFSFKAPSQEELDHDFMWRNMKALPERGRIGIFNRSYYEEVLVVRVHPEILNSQRIPREERQDRDFWKHRYEDINSIERYLTRNGIVILKFFLNISKKEQKKRFLDRIEHPDKNWKFAFGDIEERQRWNDYMKAYEDMFNATSTEWAPWYIIPANAKWFARTAVADIILDKLKSLDLRYPEVNEAHKKVLIKAKRMLESEK